jgi:hypothetical protein
VIDTQHCMQAASYLQDDQTSDEVTAAFRHALSNSEGTPAAVTTALAAAPAALAVAALGEGRHVPAPPARRAAKLPVATRTHGMHSAVHARRLHPAASWLQGADESVACCVTMGHAPRCSRGRR